MRLPAARYFFSVPGKRHVGGSGKRFHDWARTVQATVDRKPLRMTLTSAEREVNRLVHVGACLPGALGRVSFDSAGALLLHRGAGIGPG